MKKIVIILLVFLALSVSAFSQVDSSKQYKNLLLKQPVGVEFWLCFMQNYKDEDVKNNLLLELFMTGEQDANITIEVPAINYKKKLFIPGGTVKSDTILSSAELKSYETVENGAGIHITSDSPIAVYGLNRRFQTTDTYMGLPVNVLGKLYRVMCYHVTEDFSPIFAVVATEDNTIVTIIPSAETSNGKKTGEAFIVTLNKGDAYQVKSKIRRVNRKESDLTGSLIQSNKNIAVFSGHQCSYVPIGPPTIIACNHLAEQMPPISSWGKHFYVGRLEKRSQYTMRILANEDETRVFENSQLLKVLKAGQFIEKNTNENLQITADKPILVAQYSQGFNNGDSIGDPMMLLISPTQQFLRKYRFATPVNGSWNHYVNVVVPSNAINTLTLDGKKVSNNKFYPLGLSRYSIASIKVSFGTHSLTAEEPFGMYSYGFGYGATDAYDAYGNMGGQSFLEYVDVPDTLGPIVEIFKKNDKTSLIVRDDRVNDRGLYQIRVEDSLGMHLKYSQIPPNLPQVLVDFKLDSPLESAFIKFYAQDFIGNITKYTVCYTFDYKTSSFKYSLNEGYDVKCISSPGMQIGIFGKFSTNFHFASFDSTGNLKIPGKFSDATGTGGYFGISVSKPLYPNLHVTAKLIYENFGGILQAADYVISERRDPVTKELQPFQESRTLKLQSSALTLSGGADYYFIKNFYALGGFNFSLNLSNAIELNRNILIPEGYKYESGSRQILLSDNSLSSLNSFRYGIYLGLGANYTFYPDWAVFLESTYNLYLNSMINDGDWYINHLSFILGVKYQL